MCSRGIDGRLGGYLGVMGRQELALFSCKVSGLGGKWMCSIGLRYQHAKEAVDPCILITPHVRLWTAYEALIEQRLRVHKEAPLP